MSKKEEPTKALSVKEQQEIALAEMKESGLFAPPVITQRDIVIPRLLLMQPMSERVTAGKAAFGEIIDSLNETKFGGFEKPSVEIVPFLMEKSFVIFDNSDPEDKKYIRVEPITPQNEDAKYEDEEKNEDGDIIKISRIRTQTFYVLLMEELKQGAATPYIIAFSKSSLQAGKKLSTQMYMKNVNAGKLPCAYSMGLGCEKKTEEKKTWAIFNVEVKSEVPFEMQQEAFKWLKIVKEGKAKIDANAFDEEITEKTVSTPKEKVDVSGPTDY